jgi:hypothetical protein
MKMGADDMDGPQPTEAGLTAPPPPGTPASPDEIFAEATALAAAEDWAALRALLAEIPDDRFQPRLWPLLVKVGRGVPDPAATERAVALATRPGLPPSPRVILVQRLMEDRGPEGSAAAWRVLGADPGLPESKSAPNVLRCLARLRLRLPEGPSREMAGAWLARFRDRFPDAGELAGIELREQLLLLVAAEDWAGICALVATAPDSQLQGDTPLDLLTAALHLGREQEARRALALMEQDLVRPKRRVWIARRLADGGMAREALELLEEPGLMTAEAEIRLGMVVILKRLRRKAVPGELQARAAALTARLLAPLMPPRLKRPFPTTPGFQRPPYLEPLLFAAPGVSAAEEATFAWLIAQSQHSVQRPESLHGIRQPELLTYENVSVNDTGRVWDAAGRVAPILHGGTLRDLPELPPDAAFFAEAAVATDTPMNFFHWLAEGFPAMAWRLHPSAPSLPVLVNGRAEPLIRQTLALLDDPLPLVTVRQPVRVGRAHVTRRGFEPLFYWEYYGALFERLVQGALRQPPPAEAGTRLYVSRRDAPLRSLANEAAVEEALTALGFTVVTFSGRPLAQQIQLFQQAEIVVAPHGAGLAHLTHARSGLKVFEFLPVEAGTEGLRSCFLRLSAMRGHRHALWLESVHRPTRHWRIHLEAMLPALRRFMEETPPR